MTSFSIVSVVIKNQYMVCELHTSHVNQSMTSPIVIISQGVSLAQISSSWHSKKLGILGECTPHYICSL